MLTLTTCLQRLRFVENPVVRSRLFSQANLKSAEQATTTTLPSMATAVSIDAPPQEGQLVEHNGQTFRTIREGAAYILVPPNARTTLDVNSKADEIDQKVFYNPIQQFNRDLSVLAIKAFGQDLCERRRVKWLRAQEHARKESNGNKKRRRNGDAKAGQPVKIQKLDDEPPAQELGSGPADPQQAAQTTGADVEGAEDVADDANAALDAVAGTDQEASAGLEPEHTKQEPTTSDKPPASGPPFRILDALSATGLRALRYAKEIPFATSITANDMDAKAVASAQLHIKHNDVGSKVRAITGNALVHMYSVAHPPPHSHGPAHISGKYDVIDLDPYGTAAPFIDAALQALNDGGLLCVTCTDSGVFASCGYPEKTFSLYGGLPVKGLHSHEAGLRLVAHSVAMSAAKYGIAIEPLLSLSIDFYVRLFIRVRRSPAEVKFLAGKTMLVYECDAGCGAWSTQLIGRNVRKEGRNDTMFWKHSVAQGPSVDRKCEHCGSKTHIAGPMWAGPLHNAAFINKVLELNSKADKSVYATTGRIEGMLETAAEELFEVEYKEDKHASDVTFPQVAPGLLDQYPFFVMPPALAKVVHCVSPGDDPMKGALRHAGYRATRSHCRPGSIKTDAPWSVLWDIMRAWIKQKSPITEKNIKPGTAGYTLLGLGKKLDENNEAKTEDQTPAGEANGVEPGADKKKIVFDEALGRDRGSKKLIRYQPNPRENWGPMSRAR